MGNVRRSRGYNFENYLVKQLRSNGLYAQRLGGSSTGLPDILATSNKEALFLAIEAKATSSDIVYIPGDEIMRCIDIGNMFALYKHHYVVCAFKFRSRSRDEPKKSLKKHKLKYVYFVLDLDWMRIEDIRDTLKSISCNYRGKLKVVSLTHRLKLKSKKLNTVKGLCEFCKNRTPPATTYTPPLTSFGE